MYSLSSLQNQYSMVEEWSRESHEFHHVLWFIVIFWPLIELDSENEIGERMWLVLFALVSH